MIFLEHDGSLFTADDRFALNAIKYEANKVQIMDSISSMHIIRRANIIPEEEFHRKLKMKKSAIAE